MPRLYSASPRADGGIGRRARLRAWSGITGWRFESSSAHLGKPRSAGLFSFRGKSPCGERFVATPMRTTPRLASGCVSCSASRTARSRRGAALRAAAHASRPRAAARGFPLPVGVSSPLGLARDRGRAGAWRTVDVVRRGWEFKLPRGVPMTSAWASRIHAPPTGALWPLLRRWRRGRTRASDPTRWIGRLRSSSPRRTRSSASRSTG